MFHVGSSAPRFGVDSSVCYKCVGIWLYVLLSEVFLSV